MSTKPSTPLVATANPLKSLQSLLLRVPVSQLDPAPKAPTAACNK